MVFVTWPNTCVNMEIAETTTCITSKTSGLSPSDYSQGHPGNFHLFLLCWVPQIWWDLVICFIQLVVFIVLSSLSSLIKVQQHWFTYVVKGHLGAVQPITCAYSRTAVSFIAAVLGFCALPRY